MTEDQWYHCVRLHEMHDYLHEAQIMSARKLILFACACCQRIRSLFIDKRSDDVVVAAEMFADGHMSAEELETYRLDAVHVEEELDERIQIARRKNKHQMIVQWQAAAAASLVAVPNAGWSAADFAARAACSRDSVDYAQGAPETAAQIQIIRDIVNPFRRTEPRITELPWAKGDVHKLAYSIYEYRNFTALSILADLLEERGCTDAEIVKHCRVPGEHVRGCWVVDLLLDKE
jgi:hypothetical protein